MNPPAEYSFGPFRLNLGNARLLRGSHVVPLKPKAFDVLAYLIHNAGRLVTQEELLEKIWPDTIVGDSSLKSCIRQIRMALGDDVRSPQFIETVHRRGYSFVAKVASENVQREPEFAPNPLDTSPFSVERPPLIVGRETELRVLHDRLAHARSGQRQMVFVSGGPGTGKTALAETLMHQVAATGEIPVAAGQCLEHYGTGEAYLPVLEAVGRLGRGPGRERLVRVLANYAPTWLTLLPGLRSNQETTAAHAAPLERMLREMAEALERLTESTPLILVLEDLHWSDYSTLDLLSALARRREPARLMVLATYRPAEAVLSGHPLRSVKQDLQSRGLCHELPLGSLTEAAVEAYLAARFPGGGLPEGLPRMLHQRTEGQPLFLVNLVNDWLQQGVLVRDPDGPGWILTADLDALASDVPASIRSLIEKHIDRLSPQELRTLEGASIAGVEFTAAAAAAALDDDVVSVEGCCESLARRHHFLVPRGSVQWPDGTLSARYRFGHELFHRVIADGVSGARRRRLHQRLGQRLETAHAGQCAEIAGELARHFEHSADSVRAVRYLALAADRAARLYNHREAIGYIRRGLSEVHRAPESDRSASEARLQLNLGLQLQIIKGFADPEARRAFGRAHALSERSADNSLMFPSLWGQWLYYKVRSELPKAREMADQLCELAVRLGDPALELQAHQAQAVTALCLGEPAVTLEHMESGVALYDRERHQGHAFMFGQDPGVACRAFGAWALWFLGYPDKALHISREASRLSHELAQPSSQALALHFAATLHQCRGEAQPALACAELALTIAAEQGHSFWKAGGTVMRGWAIAMVGNRAEGIALMRQGLDSARAIGSLTYGTYYLALLAEILGQDGCIEDAFRLVEEALTMGEQTSERLFEAELYRIRGELTLLSAGRDSFSEAEKSFRKALAVARRQKARSLELRAATSLVRAARSARARDESRSILAAVVEAFTEGFDTVDLRTARELLNGRT
jgi:DNA-binding winged helix-turn-helix (wHTH) protein/predicted ATPase